MAKIVAVLSDIHGNLKALDLALKVCEERKVDKYVFLGDLVTDGPDSSAILKKLKKMDKDKVVVVSGNREESLVDYHYGRNEQWKGNYQCEALLRSYEDLDQEDIKYLESLPGLVEVDLFGIKTLVMHASHLKSKHFILPSQNIDVFMDMYDKFDASLYLMGHSHQSFCVKIKEKYFVNPGPLGFPHSMNHYKRDDSLSISLLHIENSSFIHELVYIDHDRQEMKDYFVNKRENFENSFWLELIGESFIDGFYRRSHFLKIVRKIAQEKGLDNIDPTPNDIWLLAIEEWKKQEEAGKS